MSSKTSSLFGVLDPIWALLDSILSFVPPLGRVMIWGCLAGVASILLYKIVSPQKRLAILKDESDSLKRKIKGLAADDPAYKTVAATAIKVSLRRLYLSLVPAVISSLPVLFLVVYLDTEYGLSQPIPGEPVALLSDDADVEFRVDRGQRFSSGWVFDWPSAGEVVTVNDTTGEQILRIDRHSKPGIASKVGAMSLLFGAPAGQLAKQGTIERLVLQTPPRDLLIPNNIAPYQWTVPFFFSVIVASSCLYESTERAQ